MPPIPAQGTFASDAKPVARPIGGRDRRLLNWTALFAIASAAAVWLGWKVIPLERFLTPQRGLGYALGIIGAGLMLLLLLYPLRKRVRAAGFMGSVKTWFRLHMIMGVLGPVFVLYHANFSFGATNSNVALLCMLIVSGSGLVGRYFYTKIHEGLYGHRTTLGALQQRAERLREASPNAPFMDELLRKICAEESVLLSGAQRSFLLLRPLQASWRSYHARWRLSVFVRRAAHGCDEQTRRTLRNTAYEYARARIRVARRIAEYEAYESLFCWWHILHLPLFALLVITAMAHVVAVHVY